MKISNGMDFVNDEAAIGKWEFFDILAEEGKFSLVPLNPDIKKGFKQIYFLPNGEKYWIFEGWTKGCLFVHHGGDDPILCYRYTIREIAGNSYMFIEVQKDDENYINVLKKVSSNHYNVFDIGIREDINLDFVYDDKIVGKWKTVSYVDNIEDFNGQAYNEELWLKTAEFFSNGTVKREYFDCNWEDKWTKGALLDLKKSVISHYMLKTINDVEYMFLEWKMGNYVYGGMSPSYYVFVRENK